MNKNLFDNAIREVKKFSNCNNTKKINFLNKNSIGREFTEEIDFEKESMNLGEDLICQEDTKEKFKMNKLRSSLIDISKEPYTKLNNDIKEKNIKIILKKEKI